MYSVNCASNLPQRPRSKIPSASMKFANNGIPSVVPIPAGFTPLLLPRHEVTKTIMESKKRNHGKGLSEDEHYISVSLEQSRELEKFYSLEVLRPSPNPVSSSVQASSAPVPLSIITPDGKKENVDFYVVQTADMVALEQVFDIMSEVFRIMILYELNEAVSAELAKMKIDILPYTKSMTKTVEDCLRFLDTIEKDVHADIPNTLLCILVLIKTDLFSWWKTVGILEVEEQWEKVVKEIMTEISEKEKKEVELEPELPPPFVIHTCGFMNPVVDIGDFNAEEVRAALEDSWNRYVNDPNTIFV